ncbi:MAG: hypothetical protein LBE18_11415 [Planctomycetaceae bacterium]|jgi:hypothetical protein|nr:hypothetical protein [Planctomycetaceae bacterium]
MPILEVSAQKIIVFMLTRHGLLNCLRSCLPFVYLCEQSAGLSIYCVMRREI